MTNRTYVKLKMITFDYTDSERNRKARTYFPDWTLTEEFENEIDERKVQNVLKDKLFRITVQDLMAIGKYRDIDVTRLQWQTTTIKNQKSIWK